MTSSHRPSTGIFGTAVASAHHADERRRLRELEPGRSDARRLVAPALRVDGGRRRRGLLRSTPCSAARGQGKAVRRRGRAHGQGPARLRARRPARARGHRRQARHRLREARAALRRRDRVARRPDHGDLAWLDAGFGKELLQARYFRAQEGTSFAARRASFASSVVASSLLRLRSNCHFSEPARARESTSAQRSSSARASAASARARSCSNRDRQSRDGCAAMTSGGDHPHRPRPPGSGLCRNPRRASPCVRR